MTILNPSRRNASSSASFSRLALGTGLTLGASAALADYTWNFPKPVTPIGRDTLSMHNQFMVVITVLFVVVFAIMLYSMIRHRKSVGAQPAGFSGPTGALQWFWVLVPFAILLFIDFVLMGIPAFHAVIEMEDTRTKADMVLKVTGLQWKWKYEYPDSGISFVSALSTPREQIEGQAAKGENYLLEVDNEVVLPVGRKVRILLTSTDVIHTWWVPQFGVKRDAIPGFLRETWVRIEEPGVYRGQCAELCGKDHGFMPIVVDVKTRADYDAWLTERKAQAAQLKELTSKEWTLEELVARGDKVYQTACVACHQPNGEGLAGVFPGLKGSAIATGDPAAHIHIVLFGKAFWSRFLHFDVLVEEGTISAQDLNLFHYTDEPQEAWDLIRAFYKL